MRRLAIGLGLLALSGCAMQQPDRVYPVFFNDFSANLDPAGMTVVNNAAAVAKQYPRIPREGHGLFGSGRVGRGRYLALEGAG